MARSLVGSSGSSVCAPIVYFFMVYNNAFIVYFKN